VRKGWTLPLARPEYTLTEALPTLVIRLSSYARSKTI
jgi:hypothetical protein